MNAFLMQKVLNRVPFTALCIQSGVKVGGAR